MEKADERKAGKGRGAGSDTWKEGVWAEEEDSISRDGPRTSFEREDDAPAGSRDGGGYRSQK